MRKLGLALAFHRDEARDGGLRNPAARQSIGMAARLRGGGGAVGGNVAVVVPQQLGFVG